MVQLGGDITKESEEMQIEALKEAYEELKEMYGEYRGYSRRRSNAHLYCDRKAGQNGIWSAKDVIGDKEMAQDAREIS